MRRVTLLGAGLIVLLLAGCNRDKYDTLPVPNPRAVGNPEHGRDLVEYYGCGSCHIMRGVPNAIGVVGPPLNDFARRVYVAGMLRNTPDNLVRWIQHPQAVVPGNAMPDMGIDAADARDIAAYLYTRR